MPEIKIPIISGTNVLKETNYRSAIMHGMYAIPGSESGEPYYIATLPGYESFGEAPLITIDNSAVYNERFNEHLRVGRTGANVRLLYSLSTTGVSTTIYTFPTISTEEQVRMPYSFNTQGILVGGRMFLYNPTSGTTTEVTDPDLGSPIDCIWIDGYYFYTDGDSLYHSDISDEFAINSLSYGSAEFQPDSIIGLIKTQDNKVAAIGRFSIEYFVNVGSSGFAFKRLQGRAINIGALSKTSFCQYGGDIYVFGGPKESTYGLYVISGGNSNYQKISTREIEYRINDYFTEFQDPKIQLIPIENNGVTLIYVHLIGALTSYVYNVTAAQSLGIQNAWSSFKYNTNNRPVIGVFDTREKSQWIFHSNSPIDNSFLTYTENVASINDESISQINFYTPILYLGGNSIDEIEIENVVGSDYQSINQPITISATTDGINYGPEATMNYTSSGRLIKRSLGYVRDWVAFKFTGENVDDRLAFSQLKIKYG